MHARMVRPLPMGCRLTAVMDCCHSGTGLDLPFEHQAKYVSGLRPVAVFP
jgi:metacaspase-1